MEELRAKLMGGAGPGRASTQRTEPHVSTPSAAGVEGAKGICRCARGRWRGLSGLRGDAPNHTSVDQAPPVWRAPEGPEGTGGLRDRPLRAAGSRVAISRAGRRPPAHTAAGPSGARNTSGATSNTTAAPTTQRNEAATGFPATASSRSRSAVHNSATSDQAVMST